MACAGAGTAIGEAPSRCNARSGAPASRQLRASRNDCRLIDAGLSWVKTYCPARKPTTHDNGSIVVDGRNRGCARRRSGPYRKFPHGCCQQAKQARSAGAGLSQPFTMTFLCGWNIATVPLGLRSATDAARNSPDVAGKQDVCCIRRAAPCKTYASYPVVAADSADGVSVSRPHCAFSQCARPDIRPALELCARPILVGLHCRRSCRSQLSDLQASEISAARPLGRDFAPKILSC